MSPQLVWHGWTHALWWQGLVWVCVIAAGVLITQLYRYERRLVPPSVGNTLLLLRFMVLLCVAITLQEPTLTWVNKIQRDGRIVVGIDVSDSMTTADTHALPAEKFRWARALGMVNEQIDPERINAWQAAYDNHQEPEWVAPEETADPARRARLAELRKASLEQALEDVGKIPRKELARRLLTQKSQGLLEELKKLGEVQLVVFGGEAQGTTEQRLKGAIDAPPVTLKPGTSDLSRPLASAITGSAENDRLLGVVLLTDGRDNGGHDPTGVVTQLGTTQSPLYPVLLGSRLRPKDLAIGSLDFPQTVFKGDKPVLKATLNTAGFEGQPIQVELRPQNGGPVLQTVTPAGPQAELEIPLPVSDPARYEFSLVTEPQPGETRTDNNSRQFAMTVVDDKVHVLLIEGEARWEFRYIDNALKRDSRVNLTSVVFDQPYLGFLDDTYYPRGIPFPAVPDPAQSPLANVDVVILGDVDPRRIPDTGWQLIEKFVAEGGGTLVYSSGKRTSGIALAHPVLQQMLPISQTRTLEVNGAEAIGGPHERGFHLQLTPEAEAEAMFQFDTDLATNRSVWSQLPGHLWGLAGTAKPGATIFAVAYQGQQRPNLANERELAVMAMQYYGQGQVMWLGIDSTWRWRYLVGDRYHHRFWGQLGRWAANNKAVAGNAFVKFGPDRPDLLVGDELVLRARWTPEFLRRFPQLQAKVEIYRTDDGLRAKPFSTVPLKSQPNRPQVHEARVKNLPAGSYRVRLTAANAELGPQDITASVFVESPPSVELSDLSYNRELLDHLAQVSGGQLILPDSIGKIPELLRGPSATANQRQDLLLWDHWLVLLAFCVLLMAEWVMRKLNGLP